MNPQVQAIMGVFRLMVPEMILGFAACVLFLGGTIRANRHVWAVVALAGLIGSGIAVCFSPIETPSPEAVYAGALLLDEVALLVKVIALVGGLILLLLSWNEVPDSFAAEYHACLLLIIAGLCLTAAANELVTLFLALELISIPTYVLLYLARYDQAAQEAAMKYFLLSIFSSSLLLFGFSYLYGLVGTTNLPALLQTVTAAKKGSDPLNLGGLTPFSVPPPGIALVALVMIVGGLGFRITAVPFHFYAPDVYQGTSTAAAALLAFVPKVAGFVALLRVLGFIGVSQTGSGLALGVQVPMLFYILAAVTMSLGNLLALLQDNLKRLLAYSSVAHAGYMLIGLAVAPSLENGMTGGVDAVLFYLVSYGAMTIGAFGVLAHLNTARSSVERIANPSYEAVDDLAGLSRSHPGVALLMGLFLFSLIGIPLTAGFAGKFLLFFGAVAAPAPLEHPWLFKILALVGSINAAIGAWYYLRIVVVMYLSGPARGTGVAPVPQKSGSWPGLATLWICALATLAFGIYPDALLKPTRAAITPAPSIEVRAERSGRE